MTSNLKSALAFEIVGILVLAAMYVIYHTEIANPITSSCNWVADTNCAPHTVITLWGYTGLVVLCIIGTIVSLAGSFRRQQTA